MKSYSCYESSHGFIHQGSLPTGTKTTRAVESSLSSKTNTPTQNSISHIPKRSTSTTCTTASIDVYDTLQLPSESFRLLHLQPASDPSAPLEVELFTSPLPPAQCPPYDALSYRWGDATNTRIISVNNVNFEVTENLHAALKRLRPATDANASNGLYSAHPALWVDSICINQNSVTERNQQVQKMGIIYSHAAMVRLWIGEETEDSKDAMNLVWDCNEILHAIPVNEDEVVRRVIQDEVGAKALTRLLQRPYWQRMWVFQEVVLSRYAIVHCGSLQADWESFKLLDKVSGDQRLWFREQIRLNWVIDFRKALFRIAHFCITQLQAQHLGNVLQPTRHLQCLDPRDKLYALLGVCGRYSLGFRPDYSLTTREVYVNFIKNTIRTEKELSSLLTAGLWNQANGPNINLPSWTPDFRGTHGVDIRYLAASHLKYFNADNSDNDASQYFQANFWHEDKHIVLETRGIFVDSVRMHKSLEKGDESTRMDLLDTFCTLPTGNLATSALQQFFRTMVFEDSTFYAKSNSQVQDQLARDRTSRLVLGFARELQLLRGSFSTIIPEFLDSFTTSRDEQLSSMYARLIWQPEPNELDFNRREYLGRTEETTDSQTSAMFKTEHGRIGIGPRILQQGDAVVVIEGSRVPLLLRTCGSYFQLVGPCYVSAFMDGQAVKGTREEVGKLELQQILLV